MSDAFEDLFELVGHLKGGPQPTLRDWFAIHAPPPPPSFQPKVGPRPGLPLMMRNAIGDLAWNIASLIFSGEVHHIGIALKAGSITADEASLLETYESAVAKARAEQAAYDQALQWQRLIQWRWAFADAMLIARDGGVLE